MRKMLGRMIWKCLFVTNTSGYVAVSFGDIFHKIICSASSQDLSKARAAIEYLSKELGKIADEVKQLKALNLSLQSHILELQRAPLAAIQSKPKRVRKRGVNGKR